MGSSFLNHNIYVELLSSGRVSLGRNYWFDFGSDLV